MAKLALIGRMAMILLCCTLVFLCFAIFAQSQTPAAFPPDPDSFQEKEFSGGIISGFVLDEDGCQVAGAVVTLWKDGQVWQHDTKLTYGDGNVNPRDSNICGNLEGPFLFGLVGPGSYVLTAEKDGYSGSASVSIGSMTVHMNSAEIDSATKNVNVTLKGYHHPVLSQEQLSNHGAVSGVLWDKYHEVVVRYANLYLRQDGRMVNITSNPQNVKDGNYSFEHLAPGRYEIEVVVRDSFGNRPVGNWSVDVGTDAVVADLVLPYVGSSPPRIGTPTPTQEPATTPLSAASPVPAIGPVLSLISIIVATVLFIARRRAR